MSEGRIIVCDDDGAMFFVAGDTMRYEARVMKCPQQRVYFVHSLFVVAIDADLVALLPSFLDKTTEKSVVFFIASTIDDVEVDFGHCCV